MDQSTLVLKSCERFHSRANRPSESAPAIPVKKAHSTKFTKNETQTPTHRGRKRSFLIRAAPVLAPGLFYLLCVGVLGLDFVAKKAPFFGIDERLVYMEYCFGGVIVEIAALWLLRPDSLRRPIDLLTIGAALLAIVSAGDFHVRGYHGYWNGRLGLVREGLTRNRDLKHVSAAV